MFFSGVTHCKYISPSSHFSIPILTNYVASLSFLPERWQKYEL